MGSVAQTAAESRELKMVDAVTATLVVAIITLAGTLVVTILNATWLETRRQLIKRKIEKKALRDALYSEMAWTVSALTNELTTPSVTGWKGFKEREFSLMKSDVYNYTRKKPTLFYELEDAHPIELFYQWMVFVQTEIGGAARQSLDSQLDADSEAETIAFYKEKVLKKRLASAIRALDIDKLKGRLFFPRDVNKRQEKDPREFVDELVILVHQDAAEEHTQETAAPGEPEKEKT
jgi:hypothetical protein